MSYKLLPSLDSLARLPRVRTHFLRNRPGSRQEKTILGRGQSSGHGKTCGRGHKGQGKYGTKERPGYAGGNSPFFMQFPSFDNPRHKSKDDHETVQLGEIQLWIDQGRLDPNQLITEKELCKSGLANINMRTGVKLVRGASRFGTALNLEVACATTAAIHAIENAGGSVKCVYRDHLNLRYLLKPEKFVRPPHSCSPPTLKILEWYSDPAHRGYLSNTATGKSANDLVLEESRKAECTPT